MANTHNNKSIVYQNLRQSLVAPNINDGFNDKVQKQKYFDSQIFNTFGSKTSKKFVEGPIDFPMDTIIEEEDDTVIKDKLVNAYNNPLAINMGLGPLPMEDLVHTIPLTKSLSKIDNKNNYIKNSNLKFFKDIEEEKNSERNTENNRSDKEQFLNIKMSNNKKSIVSSKIDDKEGNKSSLPFHSSFNSSNPEINNNFNYNTDNNNPNNINESKDEEEEKNKDAPYTSVMSQIQNNIKINEHMDNIEFKTPANNENEQFNDNFNFKNFNDSSNIDYENSNNKNYNNYDNDNHIPKNTSIHSEDKNYTHNINEDNFNTIINSSTKIIKNNNNFNQDIIMKKYNDNDVPMDEESIKNNEIKHNIKFSEGEINIEQNGDIKDIHKSENNNIQNGDIKDIHNFPYNNENNNKNQNDNEEFTPDLINNTNNEKTNNSNFQIDSSKENENDDYI